MNRHLFFYSQGIKLNVYLNDSVYTFLGEPIAPVILPIVALVVVIDKETHVFFGESFDIEDPETTYNMLRKAYDQFRKDTESNISQVGLQKLNVQLPKIIKPTLVIPSPFKRVKKAEALPIIVEDEETLQEKPLVHSYGSNETQEN